MRKYIQNNTFLPPFPWFGGKKAVASVVWDALGDVSYYAEPFFGGGAVLFLRPENHSRYYEIVNDINGYVANFWRAVKHDPEGVAYYANNPINEIDLTARHIWLVNKGKEHIERLFGDPDYYDVKVAGWWVWGISCWIGSEWCFGEGRWTSVNGRLTELSKEIEKANAATSDHLNNKLSGVSRRRPSLTSRQGIIARARNYNLAEYLSDIAERLKDVFVCCGDWSRIVTKGALYKGKTVGVFLDPPYDISVRANNLYSSDRDYPSVSKEVEKWCLENGDNPRYRIVLAGYEGEHEMPDTWRVYKWASSRAYGTSSGNNKNSENRYKERLWISPHCL